MAQAGRKVLLVPGRVFGQREHGTEQLFRRGEADGQRARRIEADADGPLMFRRSSADKLDKSA
jgi:predicted Rossmann fold nucleotide-binding protein DprA/Smf involved in DNA uptake